ncbi:MAG: hypothetical protein ACE5G0_19245 [Rhodothermales bacterium]
MASLERRAASLDGLEGTGYLFVRRTFVGKVITGRSFIDEVDEEQQQRLLDADRTLFQGTLFEGYQEKALSLRVNVTNVSDVDYGKRFDLEQV